MKGKRFLVIFFAVICMFITQLGNQTSVQASPLFPHAYAAQSNSPNNDGRCVVTVQKFPLRSL